MAVYRHLRLLPRENRMTETVKFGNQFPQLERHEFHHLMLDCITILDSGVDDNRRGGKDTE